MKQKFTFLLALLCMICTGAWADRTSGYNGAELPAGPDMSGTVVNVTAANAQYTLDGAYGSIDGKTINFTESMTESLVLGRPTKYEGSNSKYYRHAFGTEERTYEYIVENQGKVVDGDYSVYYTRAISNVTFTSNEGVTLKGFTCNAGAHVHGTGTTDYVLDYTRTTEGSTYFFQDELSNFTFKGLTLTSITNIEESLADAKISDFTFDGCTFNIDNTASGNQAIRYYNENNNGNVKNLVVNNCTFNSCYQGVYIQNAKGLTVTDCTFNTTGHNAIAMQGGTATDPVDLGTVVITGNTIKNCGNRAIRFGNVDADKITIKNNNAFYGDSETATCSEESMKAESLADGITYDISGNTWNNYQAAYNDELKEQVTAVAKIGDTKYETIADAVAAATEGQTIEVVAAGTYTLPNIPLNVTIKGDVDGVVFNCEGSGSICSVPNGCTFNNVTFNFGTNGYHGFQHAGTINMENCTLNGLLFSYGVMNFTGCTFNAPNREYAMWNYGTDNTYTNCTFNTTGKALNVYCEGNTTAYNVTLTGCKFINTGDSYKAAVNVKETCGSTMLKYNVTIKDCTTEGSYPAAAEYDATKTLYVISPLVQVDDRNVSATETGITVTLDGTVVYPVVAKTVVAKIGTTEYYELAEAIKAAIANNDGVAVDIVADITYDTDATWTSIPYEIGTLTINGNGHTITNLPGMLLDKQGSGGHFLTVKDLTFESPKAVNESSDFVAVIVGYADCMNLAYFENVNINNATVTSGNYAGAFIGYAAGYNNTGDGPVYQEITFKNCSVTNSTITGEGSTGALIGHACGNTWASVTVDGTTVTKNTITSTGSNTAKAGSLFGTIGAAGITDALPNAGVYVCATVSGNTVTSGGTTVTTIYGRQGTSTGTLRMNPGGSYDNVPIAEADASWASCVEGYEVVELADDTYTVAVAKTYVAKIGDTEYETMDAAVSAVKSGETIEIIADVTYTGSLSKDFAYTITADDGVTATIGNTSAATSYQFDNGYVTFNNVTLLTNSGSYHYTRNVTCNNCTLIGDFCLSNNTIFNGCTFYAPGYTDNDVTSAMSTDYSAWCYGDNAKFTNCHFYANGKFLNVYCESNTSTYNVSFDGCDFHSTKSNKAAVNVKETGNSMLNYNVTISNCTTEGSFPTAAEYDATSTLYVIDPLVQVDDRNVSATETGITVTLDGTVVYPVATPVPCNFLAYKGSATNTETVTTMSRWNEILAEYPNAVGMAEGNADNEALANDSKNIVLSYKAGQNGTYYECPNFVLTDRQSSATSVNFYSPVDFTAVSGSYTRTFNDNSSSCCVPFELSTSDFSTSVNLLTFAYYEPIYKDGEDTGNAYAYFNKRSTVGAGIPCIVYAGSSKAPMTKTFDNTEIKANPENSTCMQGTFVSTEAYKKAGYYGMSTDRTKLVSAANATLGAFRSVVCLLWDSMFNGGSNHDSSASAKPLSIDIAIIDEWGDATAIDGTPIDNVVPGAKDGIYTINGVKVNEAKKSGLYIINGKKTFIK